MLSMIMKMNNQAAIKQFENEASLSQAKHVDVRLKFIGEYTVKILFNLAI